MKTTNEVSLPLLISHEDDNDLVRVSFNAPFVEKRFLAATSICHDFLSRRRYSVCNSFGTEGVYHSILMQL